MFLYGLLGLHGAFAGTLDGILGEAAGPVTVLLWLRVAGRARPPWFARGLRAAGDIGVGIASGLGMWVASIICVGVTLVIARAFLGHTPDLPKIGEEFRGGWLIAFGLILVVVAPLCEELLFRGFLFRGLRGRWAYWPAALVSSICFAIAHGSPFRLLNTFADGLILSALYEGRKSLITSIAAHATLNTIVFLFMLNHLY
ncbi:MAG: type II CAAX endopeptidase family protein [Actinomycetota bacterium]